MDGAANWSPAMGDGPAAIADADGVDPNAAAPVGGDWRTHLQPEERNRIVNMMYVLSIFLPFHPMTGIVEQFNLFLETRRLRIAAFTI